MFTYIACCLLHYMHISWYSVLFTAMYARFRGIPCYLLRCMQTVAGRFCRVVVRARDQLGWLIQGEIPLKYRDFPHKYQ